MSPIQTRTLERDPDRFPVAQLFVLALVRVAEPIALTSILPYAWKLVLHYHIGGDHNASLYAGLLIAAFALAEALTGIFWGSVSDRIGRKPVLLIGCSGTIVSLLIVGFSPNFWGALVGRFLGGALNGNIGVIQTMVGELGVKPEHEPRAYAVMPFVWSIGTIVGPAIGGYFAEPVNSFPDSLGRIALFQALPYLLPNLICAALMLISILAGWVFLEETHPDMRSRLTDEDLNERTAKTPLVSAQAMSTSTDADLTQESYGTFHRTDEEAGNEEALVNGMSTSRSATPLPVRQQKILTRPVVMLTIALGIFTYHSMTYDHLLPIFLQDGRAPPISESSPLALTAQSRSTSSFIGGLGLHVNDVGFVMSINGLIELFTQAVVFPLMAGWLGIWKVFVLVTIGHPVAYFIVPWLVFLPEPLIYPGIFVCMTVRTFFAILAYPVLLMLLKEASPSLQCLGKVNGLAASTGAACRTIASPIAGFLYGVGAQHHFSALSWWTSAVIALVGAVQALFVPHKLHEPQQGQDQVE